MKTHICVGALLSLVIICSIVLILKKSFETFSENLEKKYAIHSVFISKENILFLEEWIDYHIQLGFNRFYLYDNSKVTRKSDFDSKNKSLQPGKVNKYNINYDEIVNLTQEQVNEIMDKIVKKYEGKVNIIEWSPKDKNGNVLYNQTEAHNHCLKRMKIDKIDWCASIDLDEFLVIGKPKCDLFTKFIDELDNKVSALTLDQIRFEHRFSKLEGNIVDITNAKKENGKFKSNFNSCKNIFRIKDTNKLSVHSWTGKGKRIHPKNIFFNHYKVNNKNNNNNFEILDNIDKNIKSQIQINSKNYIKNSYI
jgi:hypothetical protein